MDAEIIRILAQNETFFVYGTEEGADGTVWLKVLVADGPLTEGQPVTGTVGYAAAEYFAQGDQPISQALYEAALRAGGITPTPQAAEAAPAESHAAAEAAPTVAAGGEQTPTVPLPTVTPVSAVAPNPAAAITITVNAPAGANVRRLPDLNADIVALLPDQTVAPAISRTPLSDWLLLDLGDGAQGWISLELTLSGGDVIGLPVTTAGELPQPTPTPAETPTPEAAANAEPVEPPAPYTSQLPDGVPGALVVSAEGVNARPSADTESAVLAILPQGAALPVVGRSDDGEWLLIELPQGGTAWIFRSTIIPSGDVNGVPVSAAAGTAATQPAGEATPAAAAEATVETTVEAPVEAGAATPAPTTAASKPVAADATVRSVIMPIYATPSTTGESIERVGKGVVLPATGRTADGQWVRVQSAAGATGWIAASAVDLSVDVETLAVIE